MLSLKDDILETGWEPEPGRTYTDNELRFSPLYRAFKAMPSYAGLPDDAILADCRAALQMMGEPETDDAEAETGDALSAAPKLRLVK